MNIKETFLKLTGFTTPFGHESDLESILPSSLKMSIIRSFPDLLSNCQVFIEDKLIKSNLKKSIRNYINKL